MCIFSIFQCFSISLKKKWRAYNGLNFLKYPVSCFHCTIIIYLPLAHSTSHTNLSDFFSAYQASFHLSLFALAVPSDWNTSPNLCTWFSLLSLSFCSDIIGSSLTFYIEYFSYSLVSPLLFIYCILLLFFKSSQEEDIFSIDF